MKHCAFLLCLVMSGFACTSTSGTVPTAPSVSPTSLPTASSPDWLLLSPAPTITVGANVTATLSAHGAAHVYELTAPATGTLVASVSWTRDLGPLQLNMADTMFTTDPLVGRIPVTAGSKYRVMVSDGAPWDYDALSLPYTLSTTVE
jgi:hypothetical protein